MPSIIQSVEAFHLSFLRILETKLERSRYAVKGGVNLRAWFASQRYSEDLDLDVLEGEVFEVRDHVEGALRAPALGKLLRTQGLEISRISRPKQTETTQRWKFGLRSTGMAAELHTKIEFSRRGFAGDFVLEPVLAEIVRPYGIPAPTANHYTAAAAIRQKIDALQGRRETQARDVWDLDHLFRTTGADPRPLPAALAAALPSALERVLEMSFDTFRGQVGPYLDAETQELFGTREAWERLQEHVIDRLTALQP